MTNLINIQYGSKICQLPKSLVNNEEFMKEIVSANVWNNKLKKSDKMNLLKYLPSFSKNDTHEKKETLKKLFLGKPINFENQIKKFVKSVKDGEFNPTIKSQKVLDLILSERKGRFLLLKRRINDLKRIVDSKKKMGMEINSEENQCLDEFSHFLKCDDPLDEVIDKRFNKIMEQITSDPDVAKKRDLYEEYEEYVIKGDTGFRSFTLAEVVNRCQNDNESGPEDITAAGPMTRKRRQLQNGFDETGLRKYAKLKWERESSDSQSESSMDDVKTNNGDNSDESGTSDTDSVTSVNQRRIKHNRHERREFRCPQDDFTDFFCLLQQLFRGAHQQRLTTGQAEERVRHWQTVNQRQISDDYNRWAVNGAVPDWVALVVPALTFLATGGVVERRAKSQWWHWRRAHVAPLALEQLYREWRCQDSLLGQSGSVASLAGSRGARTADHGAISPPLYPTEWRVRPSTVEERLRFQSQERRRFSRPYRAFTYNVHGYCAVVSPIRGCVPGRDYSGVRARGHALLVSDRPAHVTIVEIVRDAVARLPNGEGSRQDIVTLAMDSAYWTDPGPNDRTISQCISSALDRLQGEGCDPSVKYNARLKLWFYRHRGKTCYDLEEMHMRACREEMRRVVVGGAGIASGISGSMRGGSSSSLQAMTLTPGLHHPNFPGGPPGVQQSSQVMYHHHHQPLSQQQSSLIYHQPSQQQSSLVYHQQSQSQTQSSLYHHHQQPQQQPLYLQSQNNPAPQSSSSHVISYTRPSYQQFSRAVTTARDNIHPPSFNTHRPPQIYHHGSSNNHHGTSLYQQHNTISNQVHQIPSSSSTSSSSALYRHDQSQDFYQPPPHFYY